MNVEFFLNNNNAGVISARLRPLVAVKDITVGTGRKMAGELSRTLGTKIRKKFNCAGLRALFASEAKLNIF